MLNCQELGLLLIGPHSKYTLIPPPISTLYFQTPITNKSSCHRDLQLLHSRYEAIISLKKKKNLCSFYWLVLYQIRPPLHFTWPRIYIAL